MKTQDIPRTPWNFFVYLNGDNNLEPDAKDDLNEMEKLGSMPGRMNVFALVDGATKSNGKDGWSAGTRLMWIQKDPASSSKIVSKEVEVDPKSDLGKLLAGGKGELNLGDPKVMNAALKYVQQNVPSEHLFVDMWDHGDSWHASSSDDSGTTMEPSKGDLQKALDGVKVDVLGFDECLMGAREIAQVAKQAGVQQMVGSEFLEPGSGWNYADLFTRFNKLFDQKNVSAQTLARAAVDSYAVGPKDNSHLAATDLSRMDAVEAKTAALSDALLRAGGLSNKSIRTAYQGAQRDDDIKEQMDLGDFARKLAATATLSPEIRDAAKALQAEIAAAEYSKAGKGATQSARLTGLTTYAPLKGFDAEYVRTDSNPWVHTRWTDFIRNGGNGVAPPAPPATRGPAPAHGHHKGGSLEWFLQ
ncbi:MAG TPA: clostripain-related cysteine peptidase [Myxococcales bacterium]|nr:clostripain-related cysteine peptidase [Myxococcales bacterium]